jgi:2-polyprenyl-6-hydroxyphenyl methylase/3-demethylubiquinone-9 3-methyltransferase
MESSYYHHTESTTAQHKIRMSELLRILRRINPDKSPMFEIGAGNGRTAKTLGDAGYPVLGVEPSPRGVEYARSIGADIKDGSAYDDLAAKYGKFDVVFALEVIEHLYFPGQLVKSAYNLLNAGGHLILSTPYHGYWKVLLLAASGKMDEHFNSLHDHGHIKFWSKRTLKILLEGNGFPDVQFTYVGRPYPFSTSFFACATRADSM